MTLEAALTSYRARALEYVDALGSIDHAAAADVALLETWARNVTGPIIDVGCGPGQWTHHLSGLGLTVEGIDPVPEFIESARATYPDVRYRLGHAGDLGVDSDKLGGVLAWYSLIHTDPEGVDGPLREFARCIHPGGSLALGFFAGPRVKSFEHAVSTAYYWPIDLLASKVERAGFTITHTESRTDPGSRTHGAILATRQRS